MKTKYIMLFFTIVLLLGCSEKWLDEPKIQGLLPAEDMLSSTSSLDALMTGAYAEGFWNVSWVGMSQLMGEFLGDTFAPGAGLGSAPDDDNRILYRREYLNVTWGQQGRFEQYTSRGVNMSNMVIKACRENLPKDAAFSSQKNRLLGEALFWRSMAQFELIRAHGRQWDPNTISSNDLQKKVIMRTVPIFGTDDIPLYRSTVKEAYDILIASLEEAITLLPEKYDPALGHPTAFQSRGTKYAAMALLAKVYFQQSDFVNLKRILAMSIGTTPGTSNFPLATDLKKIYQRSTIPSGAKDEVMLEYFQIGPNTTNRAGKSMEMNFLRPLANVLAKPSAQFKDSAAFEVGDARFVSMMRVYKPGKTALADTVAKNNLTDPATLKANEWTVNKFVINFNVPVLRSAELILMRAEMNAMENKLTEALADINYIRLAHGKLTTPLVNTDKKVVYNWVLRERTREMWAEGNRGYDLLRRGALTKGAVKLWAGERQEVLSDCYNSQPVVEWDAPQLLYPIMPSEGNKNPLYDKE